MPDSDAKSPRALDGGLVFTHSLTQTASIAKCKDLDFVPGSQPIINMNDACDGAHIYIYIYINQGKTIKYINNTLAKSVSHVEMKAECRCKEHIYYIYIYIMEGMEGQSGQ